MKQQLFLNSSEVMAFCGMSGDPRYVKTVCEKLGIYPAYEQKFGRGGIRFYSTSDVTAAREDIIAGLKKHMPDAAIPEQIERNQFAPRKEMIDAINRLEAKIDTLIAMWEKQ